MGDDIIGSFSTLITTVSDVGREVINLPREHRQQYRRAVEETFQVLDSAILLVINRLGNIIEKGQDKDELVKQLRALDNFQEWENKQREVYMCNALRTVSGEMDSLKVRIMDRLSVSSRNELGMLVSEALQKGEQSFGDFINKSIRYLAKLADDAVTTEEKRKDVLHTIDSLREQMKAERRRLMEEEKKFYDAIRAK